MRLKQSKTLAVTAAALCSLFALTPASYAQEEGRTAERQETRRTPAMRENVYSRLAEAQACAEVDDMVCAEELLAEVRAMDNLNSYEIAQMWSFYAFIYFSQDNMQEALRAYLNVLEQPDLPIGLEQDTMFTVAQLYQATEQYEEALAMLDRWFAVADNPGAQPYYLKAVIHYQLQQFREGIEPVQTAIRIRDERGEEPEEGWYQLLNVFYFELEDYPNVIRTLTTLVETWPKKEYLVQLAGIYGQEGNEDRQLALFQAAHEGGWLERGTELVTLAQMLLQADVPYQAALILEEGLDNGTIDSTESNWRTLAQAWQLSQDDERALPPLRRASSLSSDGELDMMIAQSHANLAQWDECVEAARDSLRRGLNRDDQANLLLGNCLSQQRRYNEALEAFRTALRDDRSRSAANQWIRYIEGEIARERELNAMLGDG